MGLLDTIEETNKLSLSELRKRVPSKFTLTPKQENAGELYLMKVKNRKKVEKKDNIIRESPKNTRLILKARGGEEGKTNFIKSSGENVLFVVLKSALFSTTLSMEIMGLRKTNTLLPYAKITTKNFILFMALRVI